ncbi:hypothetical protein ASZ90_019555 [hydrocarbon metagenome]|uniref:Uncharacterized protein n=1 Tax=hydrocarbon metagenome TaxID=938273 RepID=A0A0W8E333_9ZZZZ
MRKIGIILLASLIWLINVPLYATQDFAAYQYYKEVKVEGDGFALVSLDAEVLERTRDDLADIRLSNPAGEEIPYQLTPYSLPQDVFIDAEIIDQMTNDGEQFLTLDMQRSGQLHNKIVLNIESKSDFYCELQIESSNDDQSWNLVTRDKIFSVQPNYHKNEITYPVSSSRYLRLNIIVASGTEVVVNGARVGFISAFSSPAQELQGSVLSQEDDRQTGKSLIIFDMGVKGYYVDNIELKINGRNYQRMTTVYSSNDREDWRLVSTSKQIYHFKWSDYEALQNRIMLNEKADRYLKLEIENGSSPPLQVDGVLVNGSVPRLLADLSEGTYRLWYANPQAPRPEYDLAGFAHLIDERVLSTIDPGRGGTNPDYQAPSLPWTERNPWILNVVVIMAVLILGVTIIRKANTPGD